MINETDISKLEAYISGTLPKVEADVVGQMVHDSRMHREYFEFLKGLERSLGVRSKEPALQPATDRIMSTVRGLNSPVESSQTWRPALAAWSGVGVFVAVCLFLSSQQMIFASKLSDIGERAANRTMGK